MNICDYLICCSSLAVVLPCVCLTVSLGYLRNEVKGGGWMCCFGMTSTVTIMYRYTCHANLDTIISRSLRHTITNEQKYIKDNPQGQAAVLIILVLYLTFKASSQAILNRAPIILSRKHPLIHSHTCVPPIRKCP